MPNANLPLVVVVVLNYNGWRDTVECITSLLKNEYPCCKILIVDNGSTDESIKEFSKITKYDKVSLIQSGRNLGIAGGNNYGIRYALEQGVDLVVLLSNDTTVAPDFLEKMVMTAMSDEQIGAVGAKILYYGEPKYIWFAGAKISPWLSRAPHIGVNQPDGAFSGELDVDLLMGCVMLVKRRVFEQVGLFDERYFFQNEDLEFSYRMKKAGWKIKVNMEARIWHKIGRSIGTESYDRWYYATRNRLIFIKENLPFVQRITSGLFFAITRPFKFVEWIIRRRPDLIMATFHGWRDYRLQHWGQRTPRIRE